MDRSMIQEHLLLAERHVTEGGERIRRQHEIHHEMVRDGHEEAAKKAISILEQLEEVQMSFIADRDRLAKELAESK